MSISKDPNDSAADQLGDEIESCIMRYLIESDISLYTLVGVLEAVKENLFQNARNNKVARKKKADEDGEGNLWMK